MEYIITITYNDGKREAYRFDHVPSDGLIYKLEHCEIKSFSVRLAPIK